MKRVLSIFLTSLLLFSLVPTVSAADNEGLADAILKTKDKVAVTDAYTGFDSNLHTDESGNTVYQLYWYTEDEIGQESFSVSINSRGDFLQYRNSSTTPDSSELHFAYLTGEQMKEAARNWLGWMNPNWMAELPDEKTDYPQQTNPRNHVNTITFWRQVEGIPYCGDHVRVSVNNLTGMIVSMSANWTYETPAFLPKDAISKEAAGTAFLAQSPMQISYQLQGENLAIPVYTPKQAYLQLNARTGEAFSEFDAYRGDIMAGGVMEDTATEEGTANKNFSENERKNLTQIEGLLSEETLKAKAEALPYTGLDTAKFLSIAYESYKEEDVTYYDATLSYLTSAEPELRHTVQFDAATGELLFYQSYPRNWDDSEGEVTEEEAVKTAEAFLERYAKEEWTNTKREEWATESRSDHYLSYVRTENGIPYYGNRLTVSVDKHTGRLQSFQKNWDKDLTFAPAENLLTPEDAGLALLTKTGGMVLSYAKAENGDSLTPAIDLMYTLNTDLPSQIDAKTGELLGYDAQPYLSDDKGLRLPNDIDGHYAQDRIVTLFQNNMLILEEEETGFYPDRPITQKEMLIFVCGLKTGHLPYLAEYPALARMATRPDLAYTDPDAPVTREEGVTLILQALGYRELAELSGIYITKFEDQSAVSPDKLGYLALAQGLKIVCGDENNRFYPKESLTRADAAIMLYNYLRR